MLRLRRDKRGLSLVELVIVISIIVVLSALVFLSSSYISNGKLKGGAYTLSSALDTARSNAVTKGGHARCYLEIEYTSSGYTYTYYTPVNALAEESDDSAYTASETKELMNRDVTLSFTNSSGTTTLQKGQSLRIYFTRAGSFDDFVVVSSTGAKTTETDVTKITLKLKDSYVFELQTLSGKHTMTRH